MTNKGFDYHRLPTLYMVITANHDFGARTKESAADSTLLQLHITRFADTIA